MNELSAESIQCVVTSPPYWGLRKYSGKQELEGWTCAYGLEPTPELYVQHTIEILREIRRVLRKDGVVFWNIGDSYGSGKGTCFNPGGGRGSFSGHGNRKDAGAYPLDRGNVSMLKASGLKPKDLCLIPFRVALAAQEDGWWVRSVIIWSKTNPMPESVKDRPTESHEYILMLTKSARYYWDQDAVREPQTGTAHSRGTEANVEPYYEARGSYRRFRTPHTEVLGGRNIRSVWEFPTKPGPGKEIRNFAVFPDKLPELCIKAASKEGDLILDPLMGAGTTLVVAKKLNRYAVGYELSEEYCQLAVERMKQQVLI